MTPGGMNSALSVLRSPEMAPMEQDAGSAEHCGTCRFYSTDGRCLKFPPLSGDWARVTEDDWCGMYEQGEPHQAHVDLMGGATEEQENQSVGY